MKTMKTSCSRFIKLLLAATLFVLMLGVTASAADVKVNMTKSNGIYTYSGVNVNINDNIYHKITVPKDGLLTVTGNEIWSSSYYGTSYYSMYVELYNSKMKPLVANKESVSYKNEDYVFYGVKKGTYYIKVSGEKNYLLVAAFEKMPNKGGSSKAKAKTIKAKKYQKGIMPAGEKAKAADWYKFKVSKKKVLNLYIEAANNGYFEFYLYGPSYKKGIRIDSLMNKSGSYYSINGRTNKKMKVATGTYYIKVIRSSSSKKASGAYQIKWKLS